MLGIRAEKIQWLSEIWNEQSQQTIKMCLEGLEELYVPETSWNVFVFIWYVQQASLFYVMLKYAPITSVAYNRR